jgi:hypothetical protein
MYQFQATSQERGSPANAAASATAPDSAAIPADRQTDGAPTLANKTGPRVGDGLLRDFSRFAGMMQSLEPRRDARSPGMRGKSDMRGRIGDGVTKDSPAAAALDPVLDKGLADLQRTGEYAAYLGAMVVIVQNGVSGLKRLQQG